MKQLRLVIDTNVLVSALLWGGTPGRLIELVGERKIQLYTSRVLLNELNEVLRRKKFVNRVAATGLTIAQMVTNYRRITTLVTARPLAQPVSRDIDDDAVLACAIAARADLIVSGDDDLLALGRYTHIEIVTTSSVITQICG